MNNSNIYEKITNALIEQLEKGIIPWQKPWLNMGGAVSHTNGKPYSWLNQWLLENKDGEYLTFKQIQDAGGTIKKGEKSHFVVFWSFVKKYETNENGEKEIVGEFPILKYYNVWHIDQCNGITAKYETTTKGFENEPIVAAEEVVKAYIEREKLPLKRDGKCDKAFYSPQLDEVRIPNISQFANVEEYYSTLFHELTHSSGAKNRLNRDGIVKFDIFGSEQYSKEELIAEMGAAFLVNQLGLNAEKAFNNSVAYIQSWLKRLKNDKKLIVLAASKAEQAAKFILTGEKPKNG